MLPASEAETIDPCVQVKQINHINRLLNIHSKPAPEIWTNKALRRYFFIEDDMRRSIYDRTAFSRSSRRICWIVSRNITSLRKMLKDAKSGGVSGEQVT